MVLSEKVIKWKLLLLCFIIINTTLVHETEGEKNYPSNQRRRFIIQEAVLNYFFYVVVMYRGLLVNARKISVEKNG